METIKVPKQTLSFVCVVFRFPIFEKLKVIKFYHHYLLVILDLTSILMYRVCNVLLIMVVVFFYLKYYL